VRLLSGLVLTLIAVVSAAAETTEKAPGGAHAVLAAAAAEAVAYGDTRFAFTLDHWSEQNGEELALRLRFDPRKARGEQWSLLNGSKDDLSKNQKKAFKQIQKTTNPDDALVYDRLGDELGNVVLVEETAEIAKFKAPVVDDELPPDALEMTVTLDKTAGYVSQIDVRALKPFKPAAVAKIKSMTQSQTYVVPDGGGFAMLQTSENEVAGKAMLKSFTSHSRQTYSDIVPIDPSELPPADAD